MAIELVRASEIQAAGQCGLVSLERGRCAGTNLSEHHIVYRSRGGTNHPENLVAICGDHHEAIHQQNPEIQEDETGRYLDMDRRWYLLPDIEGKLESGATVALEMIQEGADEANVGFWKMCRGLEWLDRHSAWWVVDCEDVVEFAREFELPTVRRDTLKNWIRAERRRHELYDPDAILRLGPPARRVMEQASAALTALPPGQQESALLALEGGAPSSEVIEQVRGERDSHISDAKHAEGDVDGKQEYVVKIRAEPALFELRIAAESQGAAREAAISRVRGYKSVVGIDVASTEVSCDQDS